MTVPSCAHHVAVRVEDIERSVDFYAVVFGAVQLTLPKLYEGPIAAKIIAANEDVRFSLCHIRIGDGYIELFEFHEPKVPQIPIKHSAANIMHLGMHVEDVVAAGERIEASGGKQMMDEPITITGVGKILTCCDPDNNVLELFEAPQLAVIEASLAANPQYRPPCAH
jgi:predicted enzyme related to lactoylglutathione lyase